MIDDAKTAQLPTSVQGKESKRQKMPACKNVIGTRGQFCTPNVTHSASADHDEEQKPHSETHRVSVNPKWQLKEEGNVVNAPCASTPPGHLTHPLD
jgi:hypothetical protein